MPLDFSASGGAWRTKWQVTVGGKDVTDNMRPWLVSIEVEDKDGTATDSVRLVFDDSRSQLKFPQAGSVIKVELQGLEVFVGIIDEVRSQGARGQGRLVTISGKGFDSLGNPKSPLDFHKDDTTLGEFLNAAALKAGLDSIQIDPSFKSIHRDYWSADNESFIHLGARLALEFGATFKVRDKVGVFAKRDGPSTTVSGLTLKAITATYGDNLLSWDISPFIARPRHKKSRQTWLNRKKAKWEEKVVEIEDLFIKDGVVTQPAYTSHDADAAEKKATGKKTKAQRESGHGTVIMLLNAEAKAEATFTLKDARPGVDGEYRITSVRHVVHRSSGSETQLEIKKPMPEEDDRKDNKSATKSGGTFDYNREQAEADIYKEYNKDFPNANAVPPGVIPSGSGGGAAP